MPLLRLERLTFRFVAAGFVTLTAAVALGWWFASPWRWDHKAIFSVLGWLVFAGLLAGRRAFGWRGPRATRWVYVGALMLLLAYVGSRFVIEVLLQRHALPHDGLAAAGAQASVRSDDPLPAADPVHRARGLGDAAAAPARAVAPAASRAAMAGHMPTPTRGRSCWRVRIAASTCPRAKPCQGGEASTAARRIAPSSRRAAAMTLAERRASDTGERRRIDRRDAGRAGDGEASPIRRPSATAR